MKVTKSVLIAGLVVGSIAFIPAWADGAIAIVGSMTHSLEVTPGSIHEGTIVLSNTSNRIETAEVELKDYEFSSDGQNVYEELGANARSNGPWISFSPRRIVIPAKGISEIRYKIEIPAEAALEGTYWSMMLITGEPGQAIPANVVGDDSGDVKMSIVQTVCYGIQIVTNIGDSGRRELAFVDTRLTNVNDRVILEIDVENRGQRWLTPNVWVELYTADGNQSANLQLGKLRTYPGTSVRFRGDLGLVPPGNYTALVVADCGDDDVFGARYELELTE